MNFRKTLLISATGLAAVGGTTFASAQASTTATVEIKNIDFHPHKLTVKKGTTVTWKFEDADSFTPHNVTSRGTLKFKSSVTKQTGTYKFRFTKAGTYRYVCTIHPNMRASIVVR